MLPVSLTVPPEGLSMAGALGMPAAGALRGRDHRAEEAASSPEVTTRFNRDICMQGYSSLWVGVFGKAAVCEPASAGTDCIRQPIRPET